jgi:hypothetical protein
MTNKAVPAVAMGLIVFLARAAGPRPTDIEAAADVERTRAVAADYTRRMPDFVCTQTIRRSIHYTLPKNWQPTDVLVVKLRYSGQTEDRQLLQRNGRPSDRPDEPLGGLDNIGEFGGMLETVFDRQSQAEFHWESSKLVAGRQISVYSYRVPKEHSSYMLSFDPGGYVHRQIVAYRGEVDVDRETGGVLRLTYQAEGIPKDFPMQFASTAVDYAMVEVAGRRYLLPVKSQIESETDGLRSRNISEFTDYRKFGADSSIRFGDTVENQ